MESVYTQNLTTSASPQLGGYECEQISGVLTVDESRYGSNTQNAPNSTKSPPQALQSPHITASFHDESITVGYQSCDPELDCQTRPRGCVAAKLANIPVSASA
jgi:hypothetical protein